MIRLSVEMSTINTDETLPHHPHLLVLVYSWFFNVDTII